MSNDKCQSRGIVKKVLIVIAMLAAVAGSAWGQSVKDFVEVDGARTNTVLGEGLVIGLSGTGDSPKSYTIEILKNYLQSHSGWPVTTAQLSTKSVAMVSVTADIPPFQAGGTKIDVRVSVMGDAKSLAGGSLLLTPLRGPRVKAEDQTVYALASGPIIVEGSTVTTTGYIPGGAKIETAIEQGEDFVKTGDDGGYILLHLNKTSFTLANAVADAINLSGDKFGMTPKGQLGVVDLAVALNGGTIKVRIPSKEEADDYESNPVKFVATVEDINIQLVSVDKALVLINDKTKVVAVTGEVIVKKGQAAKAALMLRVPDDMRLVDLLKDPIMMKGYTPQDVIDLVKELDRNNLIKGEVISQ